jgi:probable phosphomutase (TIGR03848 family)
MAAKRTTRSQRTSSRDDSPPPTLVLFVRHGRTPTTGAVLPGRATGLHLADEGKAQADAVAERIAALHQARTKKKDGSGVTAVYASPMERTRETAAPIAKALGLRVRQRAGLLECDFGDWTGRELAELAELPEWKTVQRHPAGFRFPKGESFAEMQTRMVDTVNALVAEHPGEVVVAVSHADTIKAAVAQALGTPLDLFQRIVVGQCSVSAVLYGTTGTTVLSVNHTGDLASLAPS